MRRFVAFLYCLVFFISIIPNHSAQAKEYDIGLDHPLQANGFIATSMNVGDYGAAGRDIYSISDTYVRLKYRACQFSAYGFLEGYRGPPRSNDYHQDFSEALVDCALGEDSKVHLYGGRFQNFDRGNARYFYGLADGGKTIGDYAVFRQSPMISFAVASQDGVGVGYNFDADTSLIVRYTYTDLSNKTMTTKPTYSSRLSTKFFGINQEFEIARVGSFNATQAAVTFWGEREISDTLNFQAATALIVERLATETKELWQTVAGVTGKIDSSTQWKAGVGTIGQTFLHTTTNIRGYAFGGVSHDLDEHFSAAATLTRSEKLYGFSTTLPSTVGMLMISYRIK